jgi:L-fucose isomerase-like protein
MHFEFIPSASEFSDSESAIQQIIGGYISSLQKIGGMHIRSEQIETTSVLFYFAVTGGVENLILDLRKKRHLSVINDPVFIIAHPANNSLPASMEILAKLQQDDIKGRIFYLSSPDDNKTLAAIEQAVNDHEIYRYLHGLRLGAIGDPSDWLVASSPDHDTVRRKWGPQVISVPMAEVLAEMKNLLPEELSDYAIDLSKKAVKVVEPSPKEIDDAVRVYAALKRIIGKYKLDSITVRCFDIVLKAKTTGCFALSALTDEGIIAGCEGDVMSVIGMIWTKALLGVIPWMANPSRLDESENTLWLAHCTVPRKLTPDYNLRSHFESGMGVGIQGKLPIGPVTLLRIGGKQMDKIWLSEGMILQNGNEDNLCRTQVEIKLDLGGKVSDLLKFPLGNHMVLLIGRHMDRLLEWFENMI